MNLCSYNIIGAVPTVVDTNYFLGKNSARNTQIRNSNVAISGRGDAFIVLVVRRGTLKSMKK